MTSVSNLTFTHSPTWLSDTNRGPLVSVTTWVLIVAVSLAVCVRLLTRWAVLRKVYLDDATITVALLCAIGQTVATSLQIAAGLGQHQPSLSTTQIVDFQKDGYVAEIFYILALCFTKLSICLCSNALTPVQRHLVIGWATGIMTIAWSLASLFVVAFQCPLPDVWSILGHKCIDQGSFWTSYHILNIITDAVLLVLALLIIGGLQMRARRKCLILLSFSARTIVIGATIGQLYEFRQHILGSADLTFDLWQVTLCTEIVQALSIITACIPYLKPFLEALETGMIRVDAVPDWKNYGLVSHTRSHASSNKQNPSSGNSHGSNKTHPPKPVHMKPMKPPPPDIIYPYGANVERQSTTVSALGPRPKDSDADSQSSQSRIIKKTTSWVVSGEQSQPEKTGIAR